MSRYISDKQQLISVLLPISRLDGFFEKALSSILMQSHSNFELLILANGVEDDEYDEIKKICSNDDRVKIYRIKLRGLVFALNYGIELSSGDYIARMDADDVSMPCRFEYQINFLIENSDYGVVGGRVSLVDENDNLVHANFEFFETSDKISKVLPYRNPLCHPALMFKKTALYAVSGYRYGFMSEDHEMFIRMMMQGIKFHNLDLNVLNYRRHQGQITDISRSKKHFSEISSFMWMHFYNTKNFKFLIGAIAVLPLVRRSRSILKGIKEKFRPAAR